MTIYGCFGGCGGLFLCWNLFDGFSIRSRSDHLGFLRDKLTNWVTFRVRRVDVKVRKKIDVLKLFFRTNFAMTFASKKLYLSTALNMVKLIATDERFHYGCLIRLKSLSRCFLCTLTFIIKNRMEKASQKRKTFYKQICKACNPMIKSVFLETFCFEEKNSVFFFYFE